MTAPIAAARHVSLTPSSGRGGPARVVALADGRVGLWGGPEPSDAAVLLTVCDARGRVADGAASYPGTAVVVRSGAAYLEVRGRVRAERGPLARLWSAREHPSVVVVTLDPA